jgi:glutamyl-tRNA(Gln) amidotransferase subunit E
VIEYEAKRQHGLKLISDVLKEKNLKLSKENDVFDITKALSKCKSKIIQKALKNDFLIKGIRIENFSGMFNYSPYEGIRLGKELGQLVRFFGIGGIFHSDELPNYGIETSDIEKIKQQMKVGGNDGFLIVATPESKINFVVDSLINRIKEAKIGVPPETRLATQEGETIYLRPRPGASRMYPETDVPPLIVTDNELSLAEKAVPKPWDEAVLEIEEKYKLNHQLAEQIFDSEYFDLFEEICSDGKTSPTFVAATLCSTLTNLQRQGLDITLLKESQIKCCFKLLSEAKIAKESVEMIFENIMLGKSKTVDDAINNASITSIDEIRLSEILDEIIEKNKELVANLKEKAENPLMGIAMRSLRGRVSGELVSDLLKKKIQAALRKKN